MLGHDRREVGMHTDDLNDAPNPPIPGPPGRRVKVHNIQGTLCGNRGFGAVGHSSRGAHFGLSDAKQAHELECAELSCGVIEADLQP